MLVDKNNKSNLIKSQKEKNLEYIQPRKELLEKNSSSNLRFSFVNFKFDFINIENVFNNHFKDEESAAITMYNFLRNGLPLLETISVGDFLSGNIRKNLHCHKIDTSKLDVLKKVMSKLNFSEKHIEGIMDSGVYQIEIPYEKGPIRMVGEFIRNNFYLLFLDTNHHIYFNKKKVNQSDSLYFEYCPNNKNCQILNTQYGDCYMDNYLDHANGINKYNETYGYKTELKED